MITTTFIPVDIADTIAHNLTQKQIGDCRAVCKTWEFIFTSPLYRHVHIRGGKQFDLFYQSLFSVTRPGIYLRQLSLDDVSLTNKELDQLSNLCPNLVSFIYEGKSISECNNNDDHHHPYPETTENWSRLRRLSEQNDLTLAHRLLDKSPCNLTQLSICFSDNKEWDKSELLPLLTNAKQLESLCLDTLKLSCTELEQIHEVCPLLQKLRLVNTELGNIIDYHDEEIVASKKIQSFEFQNGYGLNNPSWLRYFQSKYPNLNHISLWNNESIYTIQKSTAELQVYYRALADFIKSLVQLKSAEFFNVLMNELVIQGMDESGIELDSLSLSDMTDYTLYMLNIIARSNINVHSLTLWGWPSLCLPEIMKETLTRIGHCSNRLRHLHFSMTHSGVLNAPLPIDILLDKYDSLESISLENTQLILNTPMQMVLEAAGLSATDFSRPNLKSFTIKNGSFCNEVFEYLAYRCREIRDLVIDSNALIYQNTENLIIDMPHHVFDSIYINNLNMPHPHQSRHSVFSQFEIRQADQSRCYQLDGYEPAVSKTHQKERPTRIQLVDRLDGPLVTVICQSVKEVYLDDFWINL